jgi:p38 MAP kinase
VGVVHRDLKPSSILVNEKCDLKICDFGLTKESQVTDYVSTGYYKAPETLSPWQEYTEKADVWSAGCIFAEMMTGNALFRGENHIDLTRVITQWHGNPPEGFPANIIHQKVSSITPSFL